MKFEPTPTRRRSSRPDAHLLFEVVLTLAVISAWVWVSMLASDAAAGTRAQQRVGVARVSAADTCVASVGPPAATPRGVRTPDATPSSPAVAGANCDG